MSAVPRLPLETALDRAWRVLNAELRRWEREHGSRAAGTDERLECAFLALLECLR
jgi:hypothetical protein